jgi:hypothetical protein
MAKFFAPLINEQQFDANGNPLVGGTIEVYLAGSSTPATTYSDKDGLVPNSWTIVLNTLGVNAQGAVWLTGDATYKFVIKNASGATLRTIDDISGMNDPAVSIDQWIVYQASPTYISATSFSVVGDQTQTLQIGRRLKSTNTGGVVYSTITNAVYGAPNTTVTVANDSGALDAGLSQVSYGIISANDTSAPLVTRQQRFTANGSFTVPDGVTTIWGSGCAGGGGGGAGGGGGVANVVGGGGAGGAAGQSVIEQAYSVTPGQVIPITIGALGTGAAGGVGAGANGGNGGSTIIGALATLTGGAGGGGGGSAATNAPGGPFTAGFPSGSYGSDAGNGVTGSGHGGAGASGPFGGGGGAGRGAGGGGIFGAFASGYGAGGGGGGGLYNGTGGSAAGGSGANGSPGIVIIRW